MCAALVSSHQARPTKAKRDTRSLLVAAKAGCFLTHIKIQKASWGVRFACLQIGSGVALVQPNHSFYNLTPGFDRPLSCLNTIASSRPCLRSRSSLPMELINTPFDFALFPPRRCHELATILNPRWIHFLFRLPSLIPTSTEILFNNINDTVFPLRRCNSH